LRPGKASAAEKFSALLRALYLKAQKTQKFRSGFSALPFLVPVLDFSDVAFFLALIP
jgi:hypothetical protein